MPSKGRGGKRTGAPGVSYTNRSDLRQQPRAVPGQPYGQAGQQVAAQQQMPLSATPPPGAPTQGAAPVGPPPQAALTALDAPSERPNEPLTAGLPTGPGPGSEALGQNTTQDDQVLAQLRGLYAAYPNSDLASLIDAAERRSF